MPAWEDLRVFFSATEFAEPVTLQPQGGSPRTVAAIFDDPSVDARVGGLAYDTTEPSITAPEADLAGMKRGDTVALRGRVFDVVISPQVDGTGVAVLKLAPQFGGGSR